ncbi:hypothetical protein SAMN04487895_101544 [Paenibacillus sophorae]|uniref:Uncharacterized protein n=1 Tax=Paenibacillus sophorae TaxID=1333845 RepID=A0A1H8GKH8_9BACL|nr:hypothetical protein [Paenibacillus sophorae]QWU14252.1 hypothetical protein KP014_20290 [Paenibacillus sophorae]SEN44254.1 hypothetical protein SAMN04487895_101544 [Paenibacillus sophorae]
MKKSIKVLLLALLMTVIMTGCTQADRVSNNLSQEADSFNITRKLTAFNQRTGEVVFVAVGNFSLQKEGDGDLAIVGEDDGGYYKHFVYLSSEIGYTCEQLRVKQVSKYKFTINYNPKYLFPVDFDYID